MSLLRIDDVTTAYGKAVVLHRVSLEVKEREISSLLGQQRFRKNYLDKKHPGVSQTHRREHRI